MAERIIDPMKTLDELLADFPPGWDVQVAACCRGETLNGPAGVRRWTATAVPRLPPPGEIREGNLPKGGRLQSPCSETPRDAVLSVIAEIHDGDGVGAPPPDAETRPEQRKAPPPET